MTPDEEENLVRVATNTGLSQSEMKAQGARCGCRGSDDYCVCQNVPDRMTLDGRKANAKA